MELPVTPAVVLYGSVHESPAGGLILPQALPAQMGTKLFRQQNQR